jgi:hypothetical protein
MWLLLHHQKDGILYVIKGLLFNLNKFTPLSERVVYCPADEGLLRPGKCCHSIKLLGTSVSPTLSKGVGELFLFTVTQISLSLGSRQVSVYSILHLGRQVQWFSVSAEKLW